MTGNMIRFAVFTAYLAGWMTALGWHYGTPAVVYVPAAAILLGAVVARALRRKPQRAARRWLVPVECRDCGEEAGDIAEHMHARHGDS